MKRILLSAIALIAMYQAHAQVVFSEDFDGIAGPTAGGAGTYVFPAGWKLTNVDNRTPATNVAYVNQAWTRREDFGGNVADSAAFSTSWYSPAGAADDWMTTPAIGPLPANVVLSWNAKAYDAAYEDGYEVRIMTAAPTGSTGVIGNLVSASTLLMSIPAENSTWTTRTVNLGAYAGQTVYVSFRNNSNDKFLLVIDDVKLEVQALYDAKLVSLDTVPVYTEIPKTQVYSIPTLATVNNNGVNAITNVGLKLNVYNGAMSQIYSNTGSTVATLAPGANVQLSAGTYALPATPDTYTFQYVVTHSEADSYVLNDTLYNSITVTDSVYARDNGIVTGSLGIGAGNGGFLGQSFTINAPAALSSISYYVTRGYTGARTAAVLWNTVGGVPSSIVASTDTILYPDDSARFYTRPIHGGPSLLAAGTYAVTAVEFDSTLALGQTSGIFRAGSTWVNWPTSPFGTWAHNEAFGGGFAKEYAIRLNLNYDCSAFFVTASSAGSATCSTCADGSAMAALTSGTSPFSYSWSSGATGASATGLNPGVYTVTVTDGHGCIKMDTVNIHNTCTGFVASSTATDATCAVCADGTATASAVGGTSLVYTWSSGGTGATETGLNPGTYSVTVGEVGGCTSTSTVTVNNDCSGFTTAVTVTDATCPTCADGTATVATGGADGSATYTWVPAGGTAATATGLTAGTYTVTVMDGSCSSTAIATVASATATGIKENAVSANTTIYPNPGKGAFTVTIPEEFGNETTISVANYLGQVVFGKSVTGFGNKDLDLSGLPSGKYMVKFTSAKYTVNKNLTIIK